MFAYKLFLSLNISDSNLFFSENCHAPPLKKVNPHFPSNTPPPPLKVEVLSRPPFLKIWLKAQFPFPLQKGGGGGGGGGVHDAEQVKGSRISILSLSSKVSNLI